MLRSRWIGWACGAGIIALSSAAAQAGPPCDEYNPAAPASSTQIRLDSSDFVDESRDQMRSFIATDSIGRVEVSVVSASPRDAIRSVAAVPEISGFSPYYGEKLKGIGIAVALSSPARPASVILNVRQVCARYFRNTFLYY